MTTSTTSDFFVSYTNADKGWAEWIAFTLKDVGYSVRLQSWDMPPGGNFVLQIHELVSTSARTILVMSSAALSGQPFVDMEWAAALVRDPDGRKGTLVPVRIDDCDPIGLLAPITYIDLAVGERDEARRCLLDGLRVGTGPEAEPPFPR